MKVLSIVKKQNGTIELETEVNYGLFKRKVYYVKSKGAILRLEKPDKYYDTGLSEYFLVYKLFDLPATEETVLANEKTQV